MYIIHETEQFSLKDTQYVCFIFKSQNGEGEKH